MIPHDCGSPFPERIVLMLVGADEYMEIAIFQVCDLSQPSETRKAALVRRGCVALTFVPFRPKIPANVHFVPTH